MGIVVIERVEVHSGKTEKRNHKKTAIKSFDFSNCPLLNCYIGYNWHTVHQRLHPAGSISSLLFGVLDN